MAKEMLINVSEGEECRIALMDGGKLEELYMERTSSTSHVGNIYKGRVTNVEPSIQAAFVDFGLGRNGFLHISDLMPQYFGKKLESGPGPMELYTEGDLVTRTVRDVYTSDVDRIVVDNKEVAKRVKEVIKLTSPRTKNKLELHEERIPLFHKYGIEKEIEEIY